MGTEVTVTARLDAGGEDTIAATVSQLRGRQEARKKALQDLATPMARAAVWLDRWAQTNLRTEGGNVGGWLPFKRGGRWIKGKGDAAGHIDTSAKLLRDTGRLAASIMPFHTKKDAGIYSDLPYAARHHRGEGVPERRLLPLAAEVREDLRKILKGGVGAALSKNGGKIR